MEIAVSNCFHICLLRGTSGGEVNEKSISPELRSQVIMLEYLHKGKLDYK